MKLSHATQLFLLSKEIAGFSPNTIRNYRLTLQRLCNYFEDEEPALSDIGVNELRAFLHGLQISPPETELYIPRKLTPLGPKSIRNVHATLSSFWEWAVDEECVEKNIVRSIEAPNPKPPTIVPFEQYEIATLLSTVRQSPKRLQRLRDKAILLFLLDTGVRASELCNLRIINLNLRENSVLIKGKGRLDSGKGKERLVVFGSGTRKALHQYLLQRGDRKRKAWLFSTLDNRQIDRRHLATHLRRLGSRAGLRKCSAHMFRHTFAIMYLRNGGDIFTLQRLLGHSSLDMVKRYLVISQSDIESAHRKAGPVDNWHL